MNFIPIFGVLFALTGCSYASVFEEDIEDQKISYADWLVTYKLLETYDQIYNLHLKDNFYKSRTKFSSRDVDIEIRKYKMTKENFHFKKDTKNNMTFMTNISKYSVDLTALITVIQVKFKALIYSLSFSKAALYFQFIQNNTMALFCEVIERYLFWWAELGLQDLKNRLKSVLGELIQCSECDRIFFDLAVTIPEKLKMFKTDEWRKSIIKNVNDLERKQSPKDFYNYVLWENEYPEIANTIRGINKFFNDITYGQQLAPSTIDLFKPPFSKTVKLWWLAPDFAENFIRKNPDVQVFKTSHCGNEYRMYENTAVSLIRELEMQKFELGNGYWFNNRPLGMEWQIKNYVWKIVLDFISDKKKEQERLRSIIVPYKQLNEPLDNSVPVAMDSTISVLFEKYDLFLKFKDTKEKSEVNKNT